MTRREIYNKFDGKCAYCGRKIDFDDLTLDHIQPSSKGGKTTSENIYPCCKLCNNQKGDKSIEEFRSYLTNIHDYLDDNPVFRIALKYNLATIRKPSIKFFFETTENK